MSLGGTTMATQPSTSLSLSSPYKSTPPNTAVSPSSSTASSHSQCSPSSTCSSTSSAGAFGGKSCKGHLTASSVDTSFISDDLKTGVPCLQNGVTTSVNSHYNFNNNSSASPPIYPEDKFQNAFSLLQKTLEFLVNEYGVHYALMSCYKTKEKSAVVAISSPGLGGAYFSSKNGPGKDVLESWNQFCKEGDYGHKHQGAEPFASTQYYESDSNSEKVCSPLSIDEHCASPGDNAEKFASGLKRPLGVDISPQESDLKKFKTQLELESKKLESSKDPMDPKTFGNQLISPENQLNLASLGVPFPARFLTEMGKEGLPNPLLDFSAMKNFAAAAAAAASSPGNLLANNLLAAANLAGPLGMGLPNPLQPPMIPASMQSQTPDMVKASFSCASDADKSTKNGLGKMGCEKEMSGSSSDGGKRETNGSLNNGRNDASPRSSSAQSSTPTPEQVLAKGSWMCPQCMKIIKYKRNARAHLMSHAAVRPCFSCSFCDQSFTTKWNLKKHLKLNHGIDMEITDPLMNTGGSPLPQEMNKHAHALPSSHAGSMEKQRAATALANSAASAKYFSPLQSPPTMANLNTLAAATAGLYNPENLEAKESNDLKVAQHFYQNFPAKDLLNNQAEATKALQALTSVNMLMQSSLFAEQMLQFGSQFKQDHATANPAEHLNLATSLAQLANQSAVDFSNGQRLGSSADESETSSTNGDLDIDTAPGEEEIPLNFADYQASKKPEIPS